MQDDRRDSATLCVRAVPPKAREMGISVKIRLFRQGRCDCSVLMTRSSSGLTRRTFLAGLMVGGARRTLAFAPEVSVRPSARPPQALPTAAELIEAAGISGKVSCTVADARTGRVLETVRPVLALPPASVAKAITALYAMDTLGPGYRFHTRLLALGPLEKGILRGDLVLAGGGDPVLTTRELADIARQLKATGLREVAGRFVIDDTALPYHPQIDPTQPPHVGYNPALAGLNLNANRVHFEWRKSAGRWIVTMDARSGPLRPAIGTSRIDVVARGLPVYGYTTVGGRDHWTVAARALGNGGSRWLPVRNPAAYAADVFMTLARSHGIVLPKPEHGAVDMARARVLVDHVSPDLRQILTGMLRLSTNMTAEIVGLSASGHRGRPMDDIAGSGSEMAKWLKKRLAARRPVFVDHSGLGSASRLTSYDMVRALTRAGADGPLKTILREMRLKEDSAVLLRGRRMTAVAKTGTLNFVSTLAGYIKTQEGRDLAFAIFSADLDARARIPRENRERPVGAARWGSKARALQHDLVARWSVVYGDQVPT